MPPVSYSTPHDAPAPTDVAALAAVDPAAMSLDQLDAALDGFDLVLTTVPRGLRRAATTMLSSRIRQRGAVVITLEGTGELACDGILRTEEPVWEGLGVGHGRHSRLPISIE